MKTAMYFCMEKEEQMNAPPIYGNRNFDCVYLTENYPGEIEYDFNQLVTVYIDIEVASENGFPHPATASEEIVSIAYKVAGPEKREFDYTVYGCGKYVPHRGDIEYKKFKNEEELLTQFIDDWEEIGPDLIVGWYSERFDIPYIYNRIRNLFGEETANRLSPFDITAERTSISPGKKGDVYRDILGVSGLDYKCLYQKFAEKGKSQERYSLDHIAFVELGERKLSYDEYGTLHTLYKENFQMFCEYNVRDVELVQKLDDKLGLLSMAVSIAYDAKVNFYDVFSPVRVWDAIIYNYLRERMIVVPPRTEKSDEKCPGAFVKEPGPSMYKWVTSFDLNSMYPMIMIQWNISPETLTKNRNPVFPPEKLVNPDTYDDNVFSKLLNRELNTDYLEGEDCTLCASGYHFSKEKRGFVPEILISALNKRNEAKKQMMLYKADLAIINDELKDRGEYEEKTIS